MPDFKEIAKHGWHPDKGAVFGRKSNTQSNADRDVTPISHLRDPASFAPPPKRTGAGVLPPPGVGATSARPASSSPAQQYGYADQQQAVDEPPAPPRPYRVDTSGLSTAHLPPPPGRRDGADGRDPTASPPPPPYSATARPPPPSLPPRLPPRNSNASPGPSPAASSGLPAPAPPSRQPGFLNQGAVDRLGASGVSVPGFGIGGGNRQVLPPPPPSRSGASSPAPPPVSGGSGAVNELQSRFSKFGGFGKSSTPSPPPAQAAAPSQGTTWAQKQAALKTMSDFKKDPSSVSFADAKSAASTANNFRERHGEQVAAGAQKANSLNQKYGLADKVGGYLGNASGGAGSGSGAEAGRTPSPAQSHLSTISNAAGLLGKKKPPPPPPPKKKPALGGNPVDAGDEDAPPPVPVATRPF
ncbi:hypothetical protein KVR01_008679 [Diaporthe batatas]|uniref:uncharacterized protein n=1 Tax=Diaporthe batatas TaxID=748121 RepID=UPI001D0504D3|nr:uncharacterized protein KVR01_008679 [Diaporthe batatas]KAG8161692.1 hypothetical protein KVR01_008679 [Diaporthe batatas]